MRPRTFANGVEGNPQRRRRAFAASQEPSSSARAPAAWEGRSALKPKSRRAQAHRQHTSGPRLKKYPRAILSTPVTSWYDISYRRVYSDQYSRNVSDVVSFNRGHGIVLGRIPAPFPPAVPPRLLLSSAWCYAFSYSEPAALRVRAVQTKTRIGAGGRAARRGCASKHGATAATPGRPRARSKLRAPPAPWRCSLRGAWLVFYKLW